MVAAVHYRLAKAVAALFVAVLLAGCAGLRYGPDQTILDLEARNPVISDIELESGERVRYSRSGAHKDFFGNPVGPRHVQSFEPRGEATISDVTNELLSLAAAHGWDLLPNEDGERWCGKRERSGGTDQLGFHVHSEPISDLPPYVSVTLRPHVGWC